MTVNARLLHVVLLLLVALGLARPAGAQDLKLATLVPEGSIWDKSLRDLGAAVKNETGGRVGFRVYPGGVAGDEPDFLRKMRIGQLHGALLTAAGLADIDPAFHVLEVPLFFETDAQVLAAIEALSADLERRLADKGFALVHWSHAGWLHVFASKPVARFDDFRARKQFVWGNDSSMVGWYQDLGLHPVSLSASDVLTGLETGLIEALPITPLAALSLQWFRSAPYMVDHRFAPLVGAVVVTKSSWNKLSEADRATLRRLGAKAQAEVFQEIPRREAEAIEEMQKRGLEVSPEEPTDTARWLELGKAFQEKFRDHSVPREVFDRAAAAVREAR